MKNKSILTIAILTVLFISCLGDKKQVDISEMGDTGFVNTNFTGNLINYDEGMSACENLTAKDIANIYGVSADDIMLDDPTTNPNRQATSTPICSFYVKSGESDFLWLRGSISIHREIGKDEYMSEVHEATGGGEKWQEAWALQKSMSGSSEWVQNMGMAAIWKGSANELKIKMKGYTLNVYPPTNKSNTKEAAKKRDYKKAATAIAKAAGYID